jgi:hypothetical protein
VGQGNIISFRQCQESVEAGKGAELELVSSSDRRRDVQLIVGIKEYGDSGVVSPVPPWLH